MPLAGLFHCIIEAMADKGGLQLLPETRKRINEEFREAYAEESAMLSKASTPMETVEMMLEGIRGKGKPEPKAEPDYTALPPAVKPDELVTTSNVSPILESDDVRNVDQHAALRDD